MTKGYLNPFKPVWVAIPCDNGHYRGRRRQEGGSMSKHTPGPWTTNLMVGDRGCLEIKVRSADQYVADVWETRPKRSQSVANARLIAAAPETKRQRDEFLAVLRAVRGSVADSLMGGCQSFDDFHDSLSDALDAIDATIEDATKEEA